MPTDGHHGQVVLCRVKGEMVQQDVDGNSCSSRVETGLTLRFSLVSMTQTPWYQHLERVLDDMC